MTQCSIAGCSRQTTRWGSLCAAHRNHQRRHGHARQQGVSKTELAPYMSVVRKRREKNTDNPLWRTIEGRWETLVDDCRRTAATRTAMNKYRRRACEEFVRVADDVPPGKVAEVALGMFVMYQQAPHRFLSDKAFWFQLARRVRRLTSTNAGTWYDNQTGKTKRVYRDLPAKTSEIMGRLLTEIFGAPGLMLARKEQEDAERRRHEVRDIARAIEDLK